MSSVPDAFEDLPPISRRDRELVRAQHKFLRKIFLTGFGLLTVASLQWIGLMNIKAVEKLFKTILFMEQYVIWMAFLSLLMFMFFFKSIRKSSVFNAWMCAIITAEMGTVIVVQPMVAAIYLDMLYAGGVVLLIGGVSIPLSLQLYEEMHCSRKTLELWTGRYFLLSCMTGLFLKAIQEIWISIFMTVTITWFLSIHILDFSRAIGSLDFFNTNKSAYILFGTLLYYNLIAAYSMSLSFLTAVRRLSY